MGWIKYKNNFPVECDFPIIEWDEEFKDLQHFKNLSAIGIKPRQAFIKESLYWISVPKKNETQK